MRRELMVCGLLVAVLLCPRSARADLIDFGDGTIYSTQIGYAFLQDLNTARTTGYDDDGQMTWLEALAWIRHLNTTHYLGYTDWELASGDARFSPHPQPIASGLDYLERLFYEELDNHDWILSGFDAGPFFNMGVHSTYWIYPWVRDEGVCSLFGAAAGVPHCYSYTYQIRSNDYDAWNTDTRLYVTAMRAPSPQARVPEPSSVLFLALGGMLAWRRNHRTCKESRVIG
jgi:hypothetical protein